MRPCLDTDVNKRVRALFVALEDHHQNLRSTRRRLPGGTRLAAASHNDARRVSFARLRFPGFAVHSNIQPRAGIHERQARYGWRARPR